MKLRIPGKHDHQHEKTEQVTDDPYYNAQNAWLERYGHFIQQAYNWRLLAMLEAVALVIGVAGLVYVAGQSKFVPYIVDVNQEGLPINVHLAQEAAQPDPRIVHAELANWLTMARGIVSDRAVEKQNIAGVYAMVQGPASGYMDVWYNAHNPYQLSQKESVAVNEPMTFLPVSAQSYVVQWTEVAHDTNNYRVLTTQNWEASISIGFETPQDEDSIEKNPIGLHITALSWTQKS